MARVRVNIKFYNVRRQLIAEQYNIEFTQMLFTIGNSNKIRSDFGIQETLETDCYFGN